MTPDRAFVVGCPRSGTTLLQSLLAAHPEATSFPETHFFNYMWPTDAFQEATGLVGFTGRRGVRELLEVEPFDELEFNRWTTFFQHQFTERFIDFLDDLARRRDARLWIEKTPSHLRRIELIERYLPDAQFVHIIRRGCDVVASLYQVTQNFPDQWGGKRGLDECIDRWIESVGIHQKHLERDNHIGVQYEDLCTDPEAELEPICAQLGLEYTPTMLSQYRDAAGEVIEKQEQWKSKNREAIRRPDKEKFLNTFDEKKRDYIVERLNECDAPWPVS